jgi:hypothetical protein
VTALSFTAALLAIGVQKCLAVSSELSANRKWAADLICSMVKLSTPFYIASDYRKLPHHPLAARLDSKGCRAQD